MLCPCGFFTHLPFMSGGLCGRLVLLIVKLSKSLIFGESILSLSIELVAVKWLPLRWCVKCLKFCWFNGDKLPADRNATVSASKLSFVLSFRLAALFCWCWLCWCCCCTAAAVVSVWRIWLWLNVSSFSDCCWLLLFSSCQNIYIYELCYCWNHCNECECVEHTFTSTPLNSVKNESNSNGFSANWRKMSSESLHIGSKALKSHELPAISWFGWSEPVAATASYTSEYQFRIMTSNKLDVTNVPVRWCNWSKWHTCKQADISTNRPSLSGHQSNASSMNGIPATMAVPPRCEAAANASVTIFVSALGKKWAKKMEVGKARSWTIHVNRSFVCPALYSRCCSFGCAFEGTFVVEAF